MPPRRGLVWNVEPQSKRRSKPRAAEPLTAELGDGWTLVGQRSVAFGQAMARSSARAVRSAVVGNPERPWAVRGEVPLDDERSACGCTTIVFGGLRMQMPEKIFGNNWLELRHADSKIAFCFDCMGALRRWALLSLDLVDDRRSAKPGVWSGWTCDTAKLREAWKQSAWGESTNYSRREEWDWCYRTDYAGVACAGPSASGSCARAAAQLQEHVLIRTSNFFTKGSATGGATAAQELEWRACDDADAAAVGADAAAWADGEHLLEKTCKLYEDLLSELGVSRCCVRFRE